MKLFRVLLFFFIPFSIMAQLNRVPYNNQQLFLSGANLAWVNFANDIGPNQTDYNAFATVMLDIHDHGGNALRWWLHTNGVNSPQFDASDFVTGPGSGTISDLKTVLDLAWEREIGLILCLWSFDMLRSNLNSTALNRNILLLNDTSYTNAYIKNALIPMVDSLKGHPAIIAWEIFNEPEGMSNEFGWPDIQHVPMSSIQRFINLCSGAIHGTDTAAIVTNGCWSFQALTDVQAVNGYSKIKLLSETEKEQITSSINNKYGFNLSVDEFVNHLEKLAALTNYNYYSDERLIAAGGDIDGILDFYSVHYYVGLGSSYSPFTHPTSYWQLNKPIVVAEFAMSQNNGVPKDQLFNTLHQTGYAGSLPWSWTDVDFSTHADMLSGMQYMWDNHKSDVDVNGISGEWPIITITSPDTNAVFTDNAVVEIIAEASDADGQIALVEFFVNDGVKIGERDTIPYRFEWINVTPNNYIIYAVATDNTGNMRTSNRVPIRVGTPPMTRFEEYLSVRQGSNMNIVGDPTASGGAYLDIKTNVNTNTITWTLPNVPKADTYEIRFGYKLTYDTLKAQNLNVNGTFVSELVFRYRPIPSPWLELSTNVDLIQGQNTIQIQLSWGWMYLDYMAVPSTITDIEENIGLPSDYSLKQNYPNPFNPVTSIIYTLPTSEKVLLKIYDVLGREIKILVNEEQTAGSHNISFDASKLASGVYIYRLESGKFSKMHKMVYLK